MAMNCPVCPAKESVYYYSSEEESRRYEPDENGKVNFEEGPQYWNYLQTLYEFGQCIQCKTIFKTEDGVVTNEVLEEEPTYSTI